MESGFTCSLGKTTTVQLYGRTEHLGLRIRAPLVEGKVPAAGFVAVLKTNIKGYFFGSMLGSRSVYGSCLVQLAAESCCFSRVTSALLPQEEP